MEYADPDVEEMSARIKRFQDRHEEIMKLLDEMRRLPSLREVDGFSEKMALIDKQNALWRDVAVLESEQDAEDAFPPSIADAINILRHTKIGRWECGYAYDDEEYDRKVQAIADGARDREKQRGLYVGVDKTGAVCSRPDGITEERVVEAVERSNRMRQALQRFLEHGCAGIEFDRLAKNLKVMFATLRS